jgi:mRNA interferase RelE/StbE
MYQVVISNKAEKSLLKLGSTIYARVVSALNKLHIDAHPPGCKKLKGREAWRIRVGDYRVIYEIEDNKMIIRIISVGHRKDVYE